MVNTCFASVWYYRHTLFMVGKNDLGGIGGRA